MDLFNKNQLIKNRNKVAADFKNFNFLKTELSQLILERLDHVKGNFPLVLDLMCHTGEASELLLKHQKVSDVISLDISKEMLKHSFLIKKINADPLNLPFANNTFDLIVSIFGLHNFNDIPKVFKNIYNILKSGGLILLTIPCYGNLSILSSAIYEAEISLEGSASAKIHPFMDVKTLGNLISEAGFSSVITDKEKILIMYKNLSSIFKDLKGMGENNILINKNKKLVPLSFLGKFKKIMNNKIDTESGHFPINIEVCTIMAWKN